MTRPTGPLQCQGNMTYRVRCNQHPNHEENLPFEMQSPGFSHKVPACDINDYSRRKKHEGTSNQLLRPIQLYILEFRQHYTLIFLNPSPCFSGTLLSVLFQSYTGLR